MEFEDSVQEFENEKYFVRHLKPENDVEPKCLIYICHGFGEHIGHYEELMQLFSSHGFYSFGNDHYGHGQSTGHRVWVPSYDVFFNPSKYFIEETAKKYLGKKVFIYGHSMGGLVTSRLVELYPDLSQGAVLEGPFLGIPEFVPGWLVNVAIFLGRKRLTRSIPVSKLDPNMISQTKSVIERYKNDPLVYHGANNTCFAAASMTTKDGVFNNAKELKIPLFIAHGTNDKICPITGSDKLYATAGSSDKVFKRYEDAYHVLRSEEHKEIGETFRTDVVEWIENHC